MSAVMLLKVKKSYYVPSCDAPDRLIRKISELN